MIGAGGFIDFVRFKKGDDVRLQTYEVVSLPHLRHLHLHLNENQGRNLSVGLFDPNGKMKPSLPELSFASSLLSQLTPRSLTLSHDNRANQGWIHVGFCRSAWTHATSRWTRLQTITFVDFPDIRLYTHDSLGQRVEDAFLPSDLPACDPSLIFAWTFSSKIHGYAPMSRRRTTSLVPSPLVTIVKHFSPDSQWQSIRNLDIQFNVLDTQEDREAIEADLLELPEKCQGLIHYR